MPRIHCHRSGPIRSSQPAQALFLWAAWLLLACCRGPQPGTEQAPASAAKFNLVLIVGDDHGRFSTGAYGNSDLRTPNIDRLAREGLRFDACSTTTAICGPSRAALLTGLYPSQSGVTGFYPLKPDVRPLPSRLAQAGWQTALIGKRHLSPFEQYGFEWAPATSPRQGHDPEHYRAQLQEFLSARAAEERRDPFFLMVNLFDAHRPFDGFGIEPAQEEAQAAAAAAELKLNPALPDLPFVRREQLAYLRAVERLDRGVGVVLEELERTGQLDNSLVIYTSDHGGPFAFAKTSLYEDGIGVPFICRWPGVVPAGATTEALVSFVDVAPTLWDLADDPKRADSKPATEVSLEAQDFIEGTSFANVLRGQTDAHREWSFASQTDHMRLPSIPMRSIRRGPWKYVYHFEPERLYVSDAISSPTWLQVLDAAQRDPKLREQIGRAHPRPREEFFNLDWDPHELTNLAGRPEHAQRMAQHRTKLGQWLVQLDDPFTAVYPFISSAQRNAFAPAMEAYQARQILREANKRERNRNAADGADVEPED